MSFLLYRVESSEESLQIRQLELAGKAGPFAEYVRQCGGALALPLEWHLTEPQILGLLGIPSEPRHILIIDLKPRQKDAISLYRIRDVWGYSYANWTPIALRLECLSADEPSADPHADKVFHYGPLETGDYLYEFLYLNGGTTKGGWGWGPAGSVNAALLWPDAFGSFIRRINEQRSAEGAALLADE